MNSVFEVQLNEQCDDGNVQSGDGCSALCRIEGGWSCPNGKNCFRSSSSSNPVTLASCGNNIFEPILGEKCDDGGTVSDDGCSSACKVEQGWTCSWFAGSRSICVRVASTAFCGNGRVDAGETCDDGFPLLNGDGCSIACQIEPG